MVFCCWGGNGNFGTKHKNYTHRENEVHLVVVVVNVMEIAVRKLSACVWAMMVIVMSECGRQNVDRYQQKESNAKNLFI